MPLSLPPVLVPFVKVTRQRVTIIRPVTRAGFHGRFRFVFMNGNSREMCNLYENRIILST